MTSGIRFFRRELVCPAALLAVLAMCLTFSTGNARAADPAIFDVGAASKNINPDTPQYIGGYGYKVGPSIDVHDDLEARAFVVGKGKQAAVFVVVDSTGWFAAYKGAEASPYGVDKTRERIAEELNERGYEIARDNVIISTTHVHAAPAVVGIWGTLDAAYLQKMSDQSVAAAVEAAEQARPSEIWSGVGNLRSFIWQNGQGTNHPDGFAYDNEVPVMWARDPQTGATNAIYASVPNHPDQFDPRESEQFSADWPGWARRSLDDLNGGTTVIGPGTLGRQEPPGSVKSYDEVIPQGRIVANEIQRTLATATPITDSTIDGNEQYFQTPADNDDLIFAMNIFEYPGSCIDGLSICTIPRSIDAPYLDKSGPGDPLIGAHVTTVRIGDAVYTTNPGEAFPEVNFAIRAGISGARHVGTLSQSGDMLGYYYERDDYTDQQFGSSNFEDYNVGPGMPSGNVAAALAGAQAIGFGTTPQTVHAPFNADIEDRPGIQWYPTELETANPTVNIYASTAKSQDETVPAPLDISWSFGGSDTGSSVNQQRFDHTFPGPGSYEVTAEVTGNNSKTRSWTETITINPALQGTAAVKKRAWNGATLEAGLSGGSGKLIAAHWTCQDGSRLSGLTVVCKASKAGTASVTVVDGAGNTAGASVQVSKAPAKPVAKLKVTKARVKPARVKRGKIARLSVTVRNTGKARANGAKVCVKLNRKAKKSVRARPACRNVGRINPGKARTAVIRLKTTRKAAARVKVRVVANAKGARPVRKNALLRTRR